MPKLICLCKINCKIYGLCIHVHTEKTTQKLDRTNETHISTSVGILPISFGMLPVKLFHMKSLAKEQKYSS